MALINNEPLFKEIETGLHRIQKEMESDLILAPFTKDFALSFCWSSNAIEGNTLSLEETISLIEYDEVSAGHTYAEYHEAKNLYQAIQELLIPFHIETVTEEWIKKGNGIILGNKGEYRRNRVYIGSLVEAVYYPPEPEQVPELMQQLKKDGVGIKQPAPSFFRSCNCGFFYLLKSDIMKRMKVYTTKTTAMMVSISTRY